VVVFQAHGLNRSHGNGACVVDQHIDLTEAADDVRHHALNILADRQIARDRHHVRTVSSDVVFRYGEFLGIASTDGNARALAG
jgi:hypothetical protein